VDAAADRASGRRRSALYLLASSLFLLRLGSTMTAVGLPLMVLRRYHAGLDAGVTLALELLPNVVFGPVIGDAVDRSDPRRLAIAGPLLSAPAVALLSVTTAIWQVQALALVSGIGYMVGVPARMALRSQVIARRDHRERDPGRLTAAARPDRSRAGRPTF
jgi:MFS family permease